MLQAPDILQMAHRQPVLQEDLVVLQEKDQQIPGSVQYVIRRYRKNPHWNMDDTGMLVYQNSTPKKGTDTERYLELRFCITGNTYCRQKDVECDSCKLKATPGCTERIDTIDVFHFRFQAVHLSQFIQPRRSGSTISEDLLQFTHKSSFSKTLSLCGRTRLVLEALLNHSYTGSLENIYVNAQSQMLLMYSLDCMVGEREVEGFQCKFLANEADREKIIRAREILLSQIGEPLTIKALSRRVAINECYLKKGFKEMFGTTIFEFFQGQRMEHARFLLYEKGLSVTEVSVMLGYSSISHFSTAFKKHTGLKPCELLLH